MEEKLQVREIVGDQKRERQNERVWVYLKDMEARETERESVGVLERQNERVWVYLKDMADIRHAHRYTLQHATIHCNTLQYTATHCNTLQHTATHSYTQLHAAAHWHTLIHKQRRTGTH